MTDKCLKALWKIASKVAPKAEWWNKEFIPELEKNRKPPLASPYPTNSAANDKGSKPLSPAFQLIRPAGVGVPLMPTNRLQQLYDKLREQPKREISKPDMSKFAAVQLPTPPETAKKPAATSNNEPAANDKGFQPEPNWIQRYLNKKSVPKTAAAPTPRKTTPIAAPRLFSAVGTDIDGESANRWLTYDVQKGDNPTVIAKRLGIPLAQFMQWNNLNEQNSKRLQIGQQLRYLNPAYLGK